MIKIRNKRIALLLVLAMLATMFVGVGTSNAAAPKYTVVTSTSATVVTDKSGQEAGEITVVAGANWVATDVQVMYAKVTLLDDGEVTFNNNPSDDGNWQLTNKKDFQLDFENWVDTDPALLIDDILLKVSADAEGSVNVQVEIWAENSAGDEFNYEKDSTVKIASVATGDIKVKAATKIKTVTVGDDEVGSKITFTEDGNFSFDEDDNIQITIKTSGVTWDESVLDNYEEDGTFDQFNDTRCEVIYEDNYDWFDNEYLDYPFLSKSDKVLNFAVRDLDDGNSGDVVFTPLLVVKPGTTGDIKVLVSDSDNKITDATFTIATIGTDGVAVSVTNPDADYVYRGQLALFDDVSVKLNPGHALDAEDWFSVTLPTGVYFVPDSADYTPFAMLDYNGDPIEDNDSEGYLDFDGLVNNDQTAWFTVDEDDSDNLMRDIYANIKLTDFAVIADADAVVGDLNVTFAGAVTGTYKIGSVRNAFTIATTPANVQAGLTAVPSANIVITETADGALRPTFDEAYWLNGGVTLEYFIDALLWGKDFDNYEEMEWLDMYQAYVEGWVGINKADYLDIALPAGVTFTSMPTVKVTSGDLDLGKVTLLDNDTLRLTIDETSTTVSTITISNVNYSVLNQPALGNVVAQVGADYNLASDLALETLTLGSIATNPTSIYVIGASTFTVNGAIVSSVAPSYVKNDRTYLAIRDIATGVGIDPINVLWDEANQRVTLVKGDKIVQLTIGSQTMYVNGIAIAMGVAPEMGPTFRSMLPAAFIAQAFGATASWDGLTSTVTIK